ncbi:MAG: hypothetical protein COW63_12040 [Bacteroidetes bacterium CG18_big_fil_WC_8_21_14_2_50_41_14]|nr:MAG: hypothetical protein COW63_12040 [Bacteroidetes bacterium CG18_big_fil_WC_8_21_14_2_50_41_14]PJB56933.1 MAG: hypothetical protein CO098_12635 [Bacteroidetes bacterium CG_4_9_14_3_um_filter_41_19]
MTAKFGSNRFNRCIVINSLVYFVIAYYLVVFSFNIFSCFLTSWLGFDVELYYYGFTHSGKKWTTDYILLVFFVGNAFTLVTAVLFEYLYRKQRKYFKGVKLLYLWIYLISLIWFLGNIIVGAFFNFGIGAALRAYGIPFFLRLILAIIAVAALLFFGYKAQKHVCVSANLYLPKLSGTNVTSFFINQMVLPILLGLVVIILLKIPHLGMYYYVDIYLLLSFVFFIAGLFYQHKSLNSIRFKTHSDDKKQLKTKNCELSYFPMVVMVIILALVRLGLMNGISF